MSSNRFLCRSVVLFSILMVAANAVALQPAGDDRRDWTVVRIAVGGRGIYLNGKPSNWNAIRKELADKTPEQRAKMELKLTSIHDIPADEFIEAQKQAQQIVDDLKIASFDEGDVEPVPPPGEIGEYALNGKVPRPGVYALTSRRITLKQALIGCGLRPDDAQHLLVTVSRRGAKPVDETSVAELFDGRAENLELMPDDVIDVTVKDDRPATAPTTRP